MSRLTAAQLQQMQQMSKTANQEKAPLDEKSFPTAVGMDGWPLDPSTEIHIKLPKPGEPEGLDSIFGAPPGPGDQVKIVTVQEQLELYYRLGFRGQAIFNISAGPHPLAATKQERISRAQKYPETECKICTALICGEERLHGYKMLELKHAGLFGCGTCFVLYSGISHFARKLGVEWEDWESEVTKQETLGDSKLLADSKLIVVTFSKDDESTGYLEYTCLGNVQSWDYVISQGRIMDTSSYDVVELVQRWLSKCEEEHEECHIPKRSILPSRLIEVSNHRAKLCDTEGKTGAYVALSHCWGLDPIIRTEKATLSEMMVDIPWESLSKTFQDAILFTWKMGFKYIWIDSMCIIQDDTGDWEVQASKMASIYNNAQITLSATRSVDGAGGCFSDRYQEPFKLRKRVNESPAKEIVNSSLWKPYEMPGKDRDGIEKDFSFHLRPQHGIIESPLVKRAWVFQEQILSPRIVHFAPGEMYWECKSHVACECTGWEKRSETLELVTRQRKAHTQLVGKTRTLRNFSLQSSEQELKRDLEAYEALVEQYTAMHITKDFDCLPALSGITFGRQDEYLAGMWRSLLIPSLHWVSKMSEHHKMAYRPEKYRAPSWSWASVQGPIQHLRQPSYKRDKKDMEYATVLAAVCKSEGKDPRGRVVSGYLKIQGPAVTALVTGVGVKKSPGKVESDSQADLASGKLTVQCYLDIPLVIGKIEPSEALLGMQVLLMRISAFAALVLCVVKDTVVYKRIGILEIEDFQGKESIWDHARESYVFIW